MLRSLLALAVAGAVTAASAVEPGAPPGTPDNSNIPDVPEWKEVDAPPPPALRTQGLIALDVAGTTLHFGVDPRSITVGGDGVVRYVVVATSSSGAVNGMYEGIRCNAGEVKVYARYNPDSGWVPVRDGEWQKLSAAQASTRHSLSVARSGACIDNAPNGSAANIVQDLKAPVDRRYLRGGLNR